MPGEGVSFDLYQFLIPRKEVTFQITVTKKTDLTKEVGHVNTYEESG
jgi:hypothetical protein